MTEITRPGQIIVSADSIAIQHFAVGGEGPPIMVPDVFIDWLVAQLVAYRLNPTSVAVSVEYCEFTHTVKFDRRG
jgi:hypothetical protein